MRTITNQRGQAMTEFIAAMALFLPLVLGVIYVGKYSDIKHQAIQASRYAAMERALDPKAHESDAVIGNETVARFFRDGGQHEITRNDEAQGATATDSNPVWTQTDGTPLIAQYSDISVKLSAASIDSDPLKATIDPATHQFSGLNTGFGVQADVEIPVANMTNSGPLASHMNSLNLKIRATTVMAGDAWNGAGSEDVAAHQTVASVPGRAINILNKIPGLNQMFKLLVDTGLPEFGCVKPDIVPNAAVPNAKYDSTDDPDKLKSPNDKCY